jgi:hypothetical protein
MSGTKENEPPSDSGSGGSGQSEVGKFSNANRQFRSTTDPDATLVQQGRLKSRPRYKSHRVVDDAHEIITVVETAFLRDWAEPGEIGAVIWIRVRPALRKLQMQLCLFHLQEFQLGLTHPAPAVRYQIWDGDTWWCPVEWKGLRGYVGRSHSILPL